MFGWKSSFRRQWEFDNMDIDMQSGLGFRYDRINDIELAQTTNRDSILDYKASGAINESNLFAFIGFHSNDTRVVTGNIQGQILPNAYGTDLGTVWKPLNKLVLNVALWHLSMEQEFVYVGDAGTVEPAGKSRRMGLDFSIRYQIKDWLYFNTDANYAYARFPEEPAGEDYIPLAPRYNASGGFSVNHPSGLSGAIKYRYLGDRPANNDYSMTAEGYFITDFNMNYQWKNLMAGINIENLFNTHWKEAQFAYESRLQDESQPVEDIHFISGIPFNIRGTLKMRF